MSIARDSARSVALHDCDIKTYDRRMLAKLFYPVVELFNFEFCTRYYPRVADYKMNGRYKITSISCIKRIGENYRK